MGSSYIFWSIAPFALILFLEATKHHIATDRAMVIIGITCSILSFSIGIIATFIELIRYKPKIKINDNETSENNQEETEKGEVQNLSLSGFSCIYHICFMQFFGIIRTEYFEWF